MCFVRSKSCCPCLIRQRSDFVMTGTLYTSGRCHAPSAGSPALPLNGGHACSAAGPFLVRLPLQPLLRLRVLIDLATVSRVSFVWTPRSNLCQSAGAGPQEPCKEHRAAGAGHIHWPSGFSVPQSKGLCGAGCGHRWALGFACHCLLAGPLVTCSLLHMAVGCVLQAPLRACLAATHVGCNEVMEAATLSSAVCICSGWSLRQRLRQLARYSSC